MPLSPSRFTRRDVLKRGGIRVPFIASWKGCIAPGVTSQPVMSFDLFATSLEVAGLPTPSDRPIDGRSLLPLLSTGTIAQPLHEAMYWRMGKEAAVRRDHWKLVRSATEDWQLFNLSEDATESHDLASSQPHTAQELLSLYQQWESRL